MQAQLITVQPLPQTANGIPYPAKIICPYCKEVTTTYIKVQAGTGTYICCCVLLWFTLFCACLPFCIDDCKDKVHFCPKCQHQVGLKEFTIF